MKERGILFSAPMIRALLAGTKTMTRRLHEIKADRLWVKETFAKEADGRIVYAADNAAIYSTLNAVSGSPSFLPSNYKPLRWKPSIFMPRWVSRITLEVTDRREERLQDISEEDAKAEGVEASKTVEMKDGSPCYTLPFQLLWNQINGQDSWEKNPLVWVVSFKRL